MSNTNPFADPNAPPSLSTPERLPPPSRSTPKDDLLSAPPRRDPPPLQSPPPYSLVNSGGPVNRPPPPTYKPEAIRPEKRNSQTCLKILNAVMNEVKRIANRDGERPLGKRNGEKYAMLLSLHTFLEGQEAISQGTVTPSAMFRMTPSFTEGKNLKSALEYQRNSFHKSPPKSAKILRHFDTETMVKEARAYLQTVADRLERKSKWDKGNVSVNRHARKRKELLDLIDALNSPEKAATIATLEDLLKFRAPGAAYNLLQVLNQHRYGAENGPDKKERKPTTAYQKFDALFGVSEDTDLAQAVKDAKLTPSFGH